MKTLLLLRHAKSSWKDESLSDLERPLSARGKRDAPRMGVLIREQRLLPGAVISSPARRARSTSRRVARACGYTGDIQIEPALYFEGSRAYLEALRRCREDPEVVMLVGHNPDLERLVAELAGEERPFPTAALAWFELDLDHWASLPEQPTATLRGMWLPKELEE